MTPQLALAQFDASLTRFEKKEILEYDEVWFVGQHAQKIAAPQPSANNFGYDDERGDYIVVKGDHIAYRYEMLGELGRGSFGQVLRCHDHKRNFQTAVKIIRNKKRFHQQALIEVKILDHLRSRDVEDRSCTVRMLSYFLFRSHMVLVFECHSMNLYELTKLNKYMPFAQPLVKRFTAQLLVALSFLWRENIVHCDIKPENILLRYENKTSIKLIDFGSSCLENERLYTYIQSRFYRAPEIILGIQYGRPIDLWSIGCVVCEMAIGYPLFPGENEQEQLQCIMEVLGVPPQRLIDRSPRKKQFFDSSNAPRLVANSRNKIRKPSTKSLAQALRTEDDLFLDFVMLFLRWEPLERITPNEAMRHPWIAECFHQDSVDPAATAHRQPAPPPQGARGSVSGPGSSADVGGTSGSGNGTTAVSASSSAGMTTAGASLSSRKPSAAPVRQPLGHSSSKSGLVSSMYDEFGAGQQHQQQQQQLPIIGGGGVINGTGSSKAAKERRESKRSAQIQQRVMQFPTSDMFL